MPEPRRYHFIGIGGAGMSAIASIFCEKGYEVSGSDLKQSEALNRLRAKGARIFIGHRADQVHDGGVVVVSSAIPPDNVELVEARRLGLPIVHRAQVLASLMSAVRGIAVAGSHGKTTTTSLIAHVLDRGGLSPTLIIGGDLPDLGGNAKLGAGEYLVAEADESDASFIILEPYIAVVTNIEDDHLHYYGSLERLKESFWKFLARVKPGGKAVVCRDDPQLARWAVSAGEMAVTYSDRVPADYWAASVQLEPGGSRFDLLKGDRVLGEGRLNIPGRHNVQNAVGAAAVCDLLGIAFDVTKGGLASFRGVERRFEILFKQGGITIVDDYAHHPTEIRATLAAARGMAEGRVLAVFQPHRYTRTQQLHREFGRVFQDADLVYLTEIYPASEPPISGVTARLILDELLDCKGEGVNFVADPHDLVEPLLHEVKPGDLVITLGAGDIWEVARALARRLAGGQPGSA